MISFVVIMTIWCGCSRKNRRKLKGSASRSKNSFVKQTFLYIRLSNAEIYIGGDADGCPCWIRVGADGTRCCNSGIIQDALSRGGSYRYPDNRSRGINCRDNGCCSLKMAFHCHVGIFFLCIDSSPESIDIERSAARSGDVSVAASLSGTGTFTDALSIACAIACTAATAAAETCSRSTAFTSTSART